MAVREQGTTTTAEPVPGDGSGKSRPAPNGAPLSPRARRMPRDKRREQLLDVAATLLTTRGAQAVTMERLAEWAGVSKALPYSHFDNSNDVLLALRNRENQRLADVVWQAAESAPVGNRAASVIAAFFDAAEDQSDLLGMLTGPGAIVAGPDEAREREGAEFVAEVLEVHFSMTPRRAAATAPVLLGACIGAADGWGEGEITRHTAEQLLLTVTRALLAADPVVFGEPPRGAN
ncbi:MAG: TetR/AcrR family transcriptional regulator [Microthrixaceae bacterium]|nr:TetR/AcrR family transcriptional regulator [Microthrixaceae bacterium]